MTTTASRAGRPDAPARFRREWWIPAGLLALTFVPVAAGAARLVEAGADFVAVVNAVWGRPGEEADAVRALNAAIRP